RRRAVSETGARSGASRWPRGVASPLNRRISRSRILSLTWKAKSRFAVSSVLMRSTRAIRVSIRCWHWKLKTPWSACYSSLGSPSPSTHMSICQTVCHRSLVWIENLGIPSGNAKIGKQIVNVSCFVVGLDSHNHINFTLTGAMVAGARAVCTASALLLPPTRLPAETTKTRSRSICFAVPSPLHFLPREGMVMCCIPPAN
ncbi:hypothetical protein RSAG8_13931, partial [Rhizoctonia solani AG-8 WAC10335]